MITKYEQKNFTVEAVLGMACLPLKKIFTLEKGSVIILNNKAIDQIDVMINDISVAKAEVVVIDKNFGIRISKLHSPDPLSFYSDSHNFLQSLAVKQTKSNAVNIYDFKRPEKFSSQGFKKMVRPQHKMATLLASTLSNLAQIHVKVKLLKVEKVTFKEFLETISEFYSTTKFYLNPLQGNLFLTVDPNIFNIPREKMTQESFIALILNSLKEAISSLMPLKPEIEKFISTTELKKSLEKEEMCVLSAFSINSSKDEGIIYLCMPYQTIKPLALKIQETFSTPTVDIKKLTPINNLEDLPIFIKASIGKNTIPLALLKKWMKKDLQKSFVNSILKLDKEIEEPISIIINNNTIAEAETIVTGGNFAVQIIKMCISEILTKQGLNK